jgi:outer membrane receptor protein involved in Fe transport
VKNDEGIIANTGFQRQGFRMNLDQRLHRRLDASMSSSLLHTRAARGLTNNDNSSTSFYMVLPFTPAIVDLAAHNPDGSFVSNPFVPSNPVQTAALMRNNEDVWRFIGASRLTYDVSQTATHHLQLVTNGGVDFFDQVNDLFFPRELQFEPVDGQPGSSLLSKSNNLNLNLDGNVVYELIPAHGRWTATTSAGIQYARRQLGVERTTSRNLPAGQSNVDLGTNIRVRENRSLINNMGYYLQEEFLGAGQRLLLTGGIRADQSSLNAEAAKLFYYPKASASYRWSSPFSFASELKLRGAYGESGNEPLYGQRFTSSDATNSIGGLPGTVVLGTVGALDLHPERQREFEVGTDATLFNERGSLEFTVYQKNISDLLLTRALAGSSGLQTQIFNGGKMRTRGVELSLSLIPMRRSGAEWYLRTTFAATRSTITELPVPSFLAGGFGVALGAFRIAEGQSATQIVGNDTVGGQVVERKLGDATPNFKMSFTNDLTWGRWNLHALADWQQGGTIINLTKLLYDLGQVTVDYADPIPGTNETVGTRRFLNWAGGVTSNYLESASFLKVREVTLSYDLPSSVAQRLWGGVRSARLSVSGRNLFTITPYTGLDPEVSNFGNQPVARNIDVAPFPPSRSFWFSLNLGF